MNYLTHHAVARGVASRTAPEFFVGNLLPDLLALSGDGRLRADDLAPIATENPLARGVRLHLVSDRLFHGLPAFKQATEAATVALQNTPFEQTPRRLFFLAHVFVEVALDAAVLRHAPDIADDLYRRLEAASTEQIARDTARWLGRPDSDGLPALVNTLSSFTAHRFLYDYARPEGLVGAMRRVGARAGLESFASPTDQSRLAQTFSEFETTAEEFRQVLFAPDSPFTTPDGMVE